MSKSNPFTTNFGLEPENIIHRVEQENRIIESFSREKPSESTYVITGQRGTGKTVLLSTVYNYFAKKDDFVVVDPGPKDHIIENIVSMIYENGRVKKLFTKAEFNFSFQGIGISLKGETPVTSAYALLCKMLEYLKKKGKKLLVTIDEVDNGEDMRHFIQAYQALLRQNYPIFLLMTGLYSNVHKLEDDKSLTFLYRAPKIPLGPLSLPSIAARYSQHLGTDLEKSKELAELTCGYAYAYQVLGYLLYEKGDATVSKDILSQYDQYLFDFVYSKIYSELTVKEKEIISCFKTSLPLSTGEICRLIDRSPAYLSSYRDNFLKSGILISPNYGYLKLALPRFEVFLSYYQ